MSDDLKAEIEAAARASGRSMNAEIVHRLTISLREPPPGFIIELKALLDQMGEQISQLQMLEQRNTDEISGGRQGNKHRKAG
jgi:hypothetical protein